MRLTLKNAIMTRLQDHKRGYTVEELYEDIGQPLGVILVMLEKLARENCIMMSNEGVWTLMRDCSHGSTISPQRGAS
jgi:hypothetical protein